MIKTLYVLIGSGVGGALRYELSNFIDGAHDSPFPFGTVLVNVIGCFIIGYVAALTHFDKLHPHTLALLTAGFCGGFTTFSAFSLQTLQLMSQGFLSHAFVNIFISVFACLTAVVMGMKVGRV